jgi:hypothetical protein
MFGKGQVRPYAKTGTTSPIFIARGASPRTIQAGKDYFLVQIHSAQAAFKGSIWERVVRLVVASQVSLSHPSLGSEGLRAIQRSRKVESNRAEQLGLQPSLIQLVPAVMSQLSISIDFILDKENRLAALGGLINEDSFISAVSLAPGAALAAKTISGLAQKIIQTFVPAEERQPILQFSGDFDVATGGLKEGYYAILGSTDEENPIPSPLPFLEVRDGELLADKQQITRLSYVILEVRCTQARTRDLNDGAPWEGKLREAENEATNLLDDPLATADDRKQMWEKCRNLIREAQVLLRTDPNYLRDEADSIIKAVYRRCSELVGEPMTTRTRSIDATAASTWRPDEESDRRFLGFSLDEDLEQTLDKYAEAVADARRVLESSGATTPKPNP